MNSLVSLIRLPFGLLATAIVISAAGLFFIYLELPITILVFPFMAVFRSRYDIEQSFVGSFPNAYYWTLERLETIWDWVHHK